MDDKTVELYARDFSGLLAVKSSRSHDDDPPDNCMRVATFPDGVVVVTDDKNPAAGHLVFTPGEWDAVRYAFANDEF
ncbi:MAG: DUF397 domain-containing protein [Mycobacterium sp.]